jgi:hypothetical protein
MGLIGRPYTKAMFRTTAAAFRHAMGAVRMAQVCHPFGCHSRLLTAGLAGLAELTGFAGTALLAAFAALAVLADLRCRFCYSSCVLCHELVATWPR